ncbi:MAG: glutamyl-tRNA reductase [Candidatus Omnitrophica bacterium]|nr:glutamyl-tRNA reductase [Candidatus Omnitrophota bacterium]
MGANQRTAALEVRERLAVPSRDLADVLETLRACAGVEEAVVLSTCNRVELYMASPEPSSAVPQALQVLAFRSRLSPERLQPHLYLHHGGDAVAHLFRVAAGLDSMILGESEITAQVKHAYAQATQLGATGSLLHRLFQKALHNAKIVRSRTRIAEGQASIGSVVVRLVRELFGTDLSRREVLLWGAGKAAEATTRHLVRSGVGGVWIVNRTQAKAEDLAALCRGGWLSWEQALAHLAHVDIAVVCTQAPHYVMDEADLEQTLPQRGGRPLCIIDLAVPRNVDPALKRRPGIALYDIDDLQGIAAEGLAARRHEVGRCEALIAQQAGHFLRWWKPEGTQEGSPCRFADASV